MIFRMVVGLSGCLRMERQPQTVVSLGPQVIDILKIPNENEMYRITLLTKRATGTKHATYILKYDCV